MGRQGGCMGRDRRREVSDMGTSNTAWSTVRSRTSLETQSPGAPLLRQQNQDLESRKPSILLEGLLCKAISCDPASEPHNRENGVIFPAFLRKLRLWEATQSHIRDWTYKFWRGVTRPPPGLDPRHPRPGDESAEGASAPGAPSGSLLSRPTLSSCSESPWGHQEQTCPAPLARLWLLGGSPAGPCPSLIQPEAPEGPHWERTGDAGPSSRHQPSGAPTPRAASGFHRGNLEPKLQLTPGPCNHQGPQSKVSTAHFFAHPHPELRTSQKWATGPFPAASPKFSRGQPRKA